MLPKVSGGIKTPTHILSLTMSVAKYIARRMFSDCCEITGEVRFEEESEQVYEQLIRWFDAYTIRYGHAVIRRLPRPVNDIGEMMQRISMVYDGILSVNRDSLNTIRSMFAASYYMIRSYKSNTYFASLISLYFEEITRNMGSWRCLQVADDSRNLQTRVNSHAV